ncbi:PEP-utilizing enzyme [Planktomarina sp.]|nr:PEP-utilizing enzyme [Planktomarina sp.]
MKTKLSIVILGAENTSSFQSIPSLQIITEGKTLLDYQLKSFDPFDKHVQFVGGDDFDNIRVARDDIDYRYNNQPIGSGPVSSLLHADFDTCSCAFVVYGDVLFNQIVIDQMLEAVGDVVVAVKPVGDGVSGSFTESVIAESDCLTQIPSMQIGARKASYLGIMLLKERALELIKQRKPDISRLHGSHKMSSLIPFLIKNRLNISYLNASGLVQEIRNATDITEYMLTTKADTLRNLKRHVTQSTILPQVSFKVQEWQSNNSIILDKISSLFNSKNLIVRSSCTSEDTFESSAAGVYESVANVLVGSSIQIQEAVEKVIQSYGNYNEADQVLVQPQLSDVKLSGVVFTRSLKNLAPYYVLNYDETSGKTDTITSGQAGSYKTLFVHRKLATEDVDLSPEFQNLLSAVKEIESIVLHSCLDIEFAISGDNQVYIFQVRPLNSNGEDRYLNFDEPTKAVVLRAAEMFKDRTIGSCGVVGDNSIYGVMPDWNPAEIIGIKPSNLAASLYRYLIMDENWAIQRKEFGYRDLTGSPLLLMFAGQPYVDVRASLNSFIPANLENGLAKRLVNFALCRLKENPSYHDKIEFNLIPTCYAIDFLDWEQIYSDHFSIVEINILKTELAKITNNAINNVLQNQFNPTSDCQRFDQYTNSSMSTVNKALSILYDLKKREILPFAHLARCAFIAIRFLNSAVDKKVISQAAMDQFMASIETVSKKFVIDAKKVSKKLLSKEEFISQYGHLRPGTYDITSIPYKDNIHQYIDPAINKPQVKPITANKYLDWEKEKSKLFDSLREIGYEFTDVELEKFLRASIEGREFSKFLFTKGLSSALDFFSAFAAELGLDAYELQHFTIEEIRDQSIGQTNWKNIKKLKSIVKERIKEREIFEKIELPALITKLHDFEAFHLMDSQPNFIGSGDVTAECLVFDGNVKKMKGLNLNNTIVCIESADPGFDWIFGYRIAGLITKYGGGNSHMAIRAAEFNLPAVIGLGEAKFDSLPNGSLLQIDCLNKKLTYTL